MREAVALELAYAGRRRFVAPRIGTGGLFDLYGGISPHFARARGKRNSP